MYILVVLLLLTLSLLILLLLLSSLLPPRAGRGRKERPDSSASKKGAIMDSLQLSKHRIVGWRAVSDAGLSGRRPA